MADFRLENGAIRVTKTGALLRLDRALLKDVVRGLAYYGPIRLKAAAARLLRPGPAIWFTPDRPRPWYMVWNAVLWSGARIATRPEQAVAAFYFEDATVGTAPETPGLTCFNRHCPDVSKTRVAQVFEAVFGYPLLVDPDVWSGPAVEKGETNGAHDGRIVACPTRPRPGKVYQRLIDTAEDGEVVDFRTPCVGGEPVLVFVKRRPSRDRFANYNTSVALVAPQEVFSPEELAAIRAFVQAMRLDWGGLDILRDRRTGRLYVVDVNKTDMPPLALPFLDKLRATRRLAAAFRRLVDTAPAADAA